jgi:hypothetical protein
VAYQKHYEATKDDDKYEVLTASSSSESFNVSAGVRQDDKLSAAVCQHYVGTKLQKKVT